MTVASETSPPVDVRGGLKLVAVTASLASGVASLPLLSVFTGVWRLGAGFGLVSVFLAVPPVFVAAAVVSRLTKAPPSVPTKPDGRIPLEVHDQVEADARLSELLIDLWIVETEK